MTEQGVCIQEKNIGGILATTEAIEHTLDRLEKGQERFITILETIATQGTKIGKLETDVENMFGRVRKVELSSEVQGVKIAFGSGFLAIIISAVTAIITKHLMR